MSTTYADVDSVVISRLERELSEAIRKTSVVRIDSAKEIKALQARVKNMSEVVECIENHFKTSSSQSISYHRKFVKEALSKLKEKSDL